MKLKNYLLELDNISYLRKGSDNIRLYGMGEFFKEIYLELKKYMRVHEIEQVLGHQSFSYWVLNKSGIPIQGLYNICLKWKDIADKSDKDLSDLWDNCYEYSEYFGCMNGKKIKLPKILDYKLAYLLGIICGDGHLAKPNASYDKLTSYNSELRITDQNKETFIVLANLFKSVFNYNPKIYSEKSKVNKLFYRFVIKSKPLHRFLMVVCGLPVGDKRGKLVIPKLIKNAPLELKKWFIAGFFDSDGCILIINNRPIVQITQYDSPILEDIKKISLYFGLKWVGPYCYRYKYNNCNLRINRKEDIQKFLNTIPSLNPNKLKKREAAWKKIKQISPST